MSRDSFVKKISIFALMSGLSFASVLMIGSEKVEAATIPSSSSLDIEGNIYNADLNGDGSVDSADLVLFKRYLLGYDIEGAEKIQDMNGDGTIDISDMLKIISYIGDNGGVVEKCNLDRNDTYYPYEYAYRTGDVGAIIKSGQTYGNAYGVDSLSLSQKYKVYQGVCDVMDQALDKDSEFEAERFVHDYLVNNCDYDTENYQKYIDGKIKDVPWISHMAEGVFINKLAVCDGYASAFKMFMDMLGVDCKLIDGLGNGGSHAWNEVEIDGSWYMVDVTWDDPIGTSNNSFNYSYFNITDEQLRKDHSDYEDEDYVPANGTKYGSDYAFRCLFTDEANPNYFLDTQYDEIEAYYRKKKAEGASSVEVYILRTDGKPIYEVVNNTVEWDRNWYNQYKFARASLSCPSTKYAIFNFC